jgi:hypothetical protein
MATTLYELIPRDENRAHDVLPRHERVVPQPKPSPMKRFQNLVAAEVTRLWSLRTSDFAPRTLDGASSRRLLRVLRKVSCARWVAGADLETLAG